MQNEWINTVVGVVGTVAAVVSGAVGKLWLEVDRLRKEVIECEKHRARSDAEIMLLRHQVATLQQAALGQTLTLRDAFVMADADGRITKWSPGAASLFGWTEGEALGKTVTELIVPLDLRATHEAARSHLAAGPRTDVSHRIRNTRGLTKSGSEFRTDIKVDGWKTGSAWTLVAVFHPATEQVQIGEPK